MSTCFNGLYCIHLELTSRCNKDCWMCGRRKIDNEYPDIAMNYGDMAFDLVKKIVGQLPERTLVQFHNNGEPLLYPRLGEVLKLFEGQIRSLNTNGKLIVDKAEQIIDNLETITLSVIENDTEGDDQYELIKKFIAIKGRKKPLVIYRIMGDVDIARWKKLDGIIATRILHNPMGSFKYKKTPTIPEVGICLEILSHMAINRFGEVSICVRFDPKALGVIGDAKLTPLVDIWNGSKRKEWVEYHLAGDRDKIPLCSYCDFWGVPTGS
ncbi:MAG: SPASM domain-containing protein [Nitrospirae bacterium]|nr:SPASM domain-containing protein [Nitrospirota bacterium]